MTYQVGKTKSRNIPVDGLHVVRSLSHVYVICREQSSVASQEGTHRLLHHECMGHLGEGVEGRAYLTTMEISGIESPL